MSPQQKSRSDKPRQEAPSTQDVRSSAAQDEAGRPALLPPGVDVGLSGIAIVEPGKPASDVMVQRFEQSAAGEARPTLTPELQGDLQAFGAAQAATAITGTWTQNAVVDAMWSINQTRNAWVHIKGGAWKKIYNASDWSFTALTTLAAQSRQTGKPISFREEPDGMVHEIYLW
ncbi:MULTISPECIES: hypothetical protein [unclassified Streptomyces]|uniref:hypothetical protein n=1 Tax=unclassified Streptomyces TaxID=2593676 RepID=UPI003BB76C54